MKKDDFNNTFREHSRKSLSPTQKERDFVTVVYQHICNALGNNCIQIGSYPRFTAINPLHDLDVLFVLGDIASFIKSPVNILSDLKTKLQNYFSQCTKYKVKFELQTHSITMSFIGNSNDEFFGIDVVPAYKDGKNEFNLDMYIIPEIIKIKRSKRPGYYQEKTVSHSSVQWIKSDPQGYIKLASNINSKNSDYRKAVKFAKKWKYAAAREKEDFKLKSFHIEQIFIDIFQQNQDIDIFDAIFTFFYYLPQHITNPQIKDRANNDIFIDQYLEDLTDSQRELITHARDHFLVFLENYNQSTPITGFLGGNFYKRNSNSEQYLFDNFIPTFIEPEVKFRVDGWIKNKDGFRCGWLSEIDWKIETDRYIEFSLRRNDTYADIYKWKVKNDNLSPEPRGEITDHKTRNHPESTKYKGNHYVECYAIKNNICIAKHKIEVSIG